MKKCPLRFERIGLILLLVAVILAMAAIFYSEAEAAPSECPGCAPHGGALKGRCLRGWYGKALRPETQPVNGVLHGRLRKGACGVADTFTFGPAEVEIPGIKIGFKLAAPRQREYLG